MLLEDIDSWVAESLLNKYQLIATLRKTTATAVEAQPQMRRLGREYPGALRELDDMPPEWLAQRIAELDDIASQNATAPIWASTMIRYHHWLSAVLAIRQYAGPARCREKAREWVDIHYRGHPLGPSKNAITMQIHHILRPPKGKISHWVQTQLAAELGQDRKTLLHMLFPWRSN